MAGAGAAEANVLDDLRTCVGLGRRERVDLFSGNEINAALALAFRVQEVSLRVKVRALAETLSR